MTGRERQQWTKGIGQHEPTKTSLRLPEPPKLTQTLDPTLERDPTITRFLLFRNRNYLLFFSLEQHGTFMLVVHIYVLQYNLRLTLCCWDF